MTTSYYAMNGDGGGLPHHFPHHHHQHQHEPNFSPYPGHLPHNRHAGMGIPPPQGGYNASYMPHHAAPAFRHGGRPMGVDVRAPVGHSVPSPNHSPSFRDSKLPPSPPYEHYPRHYQVRHYPQAYPRDLRAHQEAHPIQRFPVKNGPMPPHHIMSKYEAEVPTTPGSNPPSPPRYNRPAMSVPVAEEQRSFDMSSENPNVERAVPQKRQESSPPSHLEDAASILLSLKTTMKTDVSDNICSIVSPETDRSKSDPESYPPSPSTTISESLASYHQDTTPSFPSRLSMPDDHTELNKLHCFIRDELLEIVVTPKDSGEEKENRNNNRSQSPSSVADESSCSSSANNHFSGRAGFRCVHCAHAERRNRRDLHSPTKQQYDPHCTRMASFYPESVSDLYRLVCLWQSCHFRKCRNIPPAVRETYQTIKQGKKTLGKTRYWVTSAEKLGLVDIPKAKEGRGGGGICFALDRPKQVSLEDDACQ